MLNKTHSVYDFKVNDYAYKRDIHKANGYLSAYSGKYDINTSGILTRLIQEAGRFCENYASDLFIDWESVENRIKSDDKIFMSTFLFGFRQNGVDHSTFILSRYNGGMYSNPESEYRSMWRLDIEADGKEINMTLGRVF